MKLLTRFEELALFILGIYLFTNLSYDWWIFPLLLFVPDISMIGYVINPKIGSYTYNAVHLRFTAITLIILGAVIKYDTIQLFGIILFSHIALDRFLGYGLKYPDNFKNTHLGKIT